MPRVASLYLPQLAIERLRRSERPAKQPESAPHAGTRFSTAIEDDPGACSVPRGGGWRPGARWARDDAISGRPTPEQIEALPTHQRPTMREMGRRSEHADHPFKRKTSILDGIEDPAAAGWSGLWQRPTIVVSRVGQRDVVTAACPAALEAGLRPGTAAAHARALIADLDVRDADPEQDHAVLDRLALHAVGHWTPTACVSGPDGLWLDLSGTSHLFGGEERFCQRLLTFLRRLGFTAMIAIAGAPGAAHALARYGGRPVTVLAEGAEAQALAELPLAALRLTPDALVAAARFGLERVSDLYPMPRGPLARRLGLKTVERLDQARGLVGEPIIPVIPFEEPRAERRLLEPIGTADAINQVIGDLVDDLALVLQDRGLGLRAAILHCTIVDGAEQHVGIGAARATRDPKHLKRMFAMRVDQIDPGLGIEAMALTAPHVEPLGATAIVAGLTEADRAPDMAPLVDQLGGRVGAHALFRLASVESDVPERAIRRIAPLAVPPGWPAWKRPSRLLVRPEPLFGVVALLPDHAPRRFEWRGTTYRVVAGDGPERIHGEWWRRLGELWAVRDYFRVEVEGGQRFWLFRRGDGVEAPTGDLSWYIHGLFG